MSLSPPDLRRMRNQLDEMDALLERMLKLPLTEPPPPAADTGSLLEELDAMEERSAIAGRIAPAPPAPAIAEPHSEGPRLLVIENETALDQGTGAGAPPEPGEPPEGVATSAEAGGERGVAETCDLPPTIPLVLAPRIQPEANETSELPPLSVTVVAGPAAERASEPHHGGGLAGRINQAWDGAWSWLGWPGRVAMHPVTRQFLGFVGVLMLSGAAALALGRWLGWAWLEPLGK